MTLRARIDMGSPNLNLRDPVLYRVKHAHHHRTGSAWHIYPSYDFAHGQEDAIEHVTHSICTLEFEDHRPLYEWFIANLPVPSRPRQYEFARLNLSYTVTSKRKLRQLVEEGHVAGLGRSAHADDLGPAPPWRQPDRDPRLRRAHRREPIRRPGRPRHVRLLHPRRPRQERPARDVRAAPAEGHAHELSRGFPRGDHDLLASAACRARPARAAVLAPAVDRSRGLPHGGLEGLQAPGAGCRGQVAQCLRDPRR